MINKERLTEIVEKHRQTMNNEILSKELKEELVGNGKEGLLKDFLMVLEKAGVSINMDELMKELKNRPTIIYEIEKPTEEMMQAVLSCDRSLAELVNHPDEELVKRILRREPDIFRQIENPSEEIVQDYLINIKNHKDYDYHVRRMVETIFRQK
jgi:hypothetical protein